MLPDTGVLAFRDTPRRRGRLLGRFLGRHGRFLQIAETEHKYLTTNSSHLRRTTHLNHLILPRIYNAVGSEFDMTALGVAIVDSIGQMFLPLDDNSWIIESLLLQRSAASPPLNALASWKDVSSNVFFILSHALEHRPPLQVSTQNDDVKMVHRVRDQSIVWFIGSNVVCKVKKLVDGVTREHTTLEFIRQQDFDFDTPRPIFYTETKTHSILFLRKLPGRTLSEAWPGLDDKWRSFYVQRIVQVCETLAKIEGHQACGVDGRYIPEQYLARGMTNKDYRPESIKMVCKEVGMATDTFVLYHADLGPTNIIVELEPNTGRIGIIDWECVGFFPRTWIRTKFTVCSGHDIPNFADATQWRSKVSIALGQAGFEECGLKWMEWLSLLV